MRKKQMTQQKHEQKELHESGNSNIQRDSTSLAIKEMQN